MDKWKWEWYLEATTGTGGTGQLLGTAMAFGQVQLVRELGQEAQTLVEQRKNKYRNFNKSCTRTNATPPNDAIVRYHEGVETVFADR